MLAGIFGSAANFVLAAIFVLAEIFVFCLFCCFTSQVNNYGHGETVSSPNHTFLGKLEEAVNQYFVIEAQWLSGRVFDSIPSGRGFEPNRRHCNVPFSKTH